MLARGSRCGRCGSLYSGKTSRHKEISGATSPATAALIRAFLASPLMASAMSSAMSAKLAVCPHSARRSCGGLRNALHPIRDRAIVALARRQSRQHAFAVSRRPVLAQLEFRFDAVDRNLEADDGRFLPFAKLLAQHLAPM